MADITSVEEQKRAFVEALLPLCPFILIDSTRPEVSVPEGLKRADLVLRVGRDPRVMGMPDLVIDERGFRATISLQGIRHHVDVPWHACSRVWVGEPYVGPVLVWPEASEAEPPKPKGLRLVKN